WPPGGRCGRHGRRSSCRRGHDRQSRATVVGARAPMTAIRQPRSMQQATELLERFAVLDGQIGEIEAKRNEAIATINAEADGRSQPLLEERDAIQAKLAAWWSG